MNKQYITRYSWHNPYYKKLGAFLQKISLKIPENFGATRMKVPHSGYYRMYINASTANIGDRNNSKQIYIGDTAFYYILSGQQLVNDLFLHGNVIITADGCDIALIEL